MKYSLRIFTIFGIPVELHISFLLLMLFIYLVAILNVLPSVNLLTSILITLLFVTVILHELSHSYVAQHYGIKIERIILLPIGGLSAMEEIPREPAQELKIALAGPLVNFLIAGIVFILLIIIGSLLSRDIYDLIFLFILMNLVLGIFNLLPAYPMDGGRVLRAFLAKRMNYIRATELAATIGKQLAIIMAVFGIFLNPFLVLVAIFIYMGAEQEYRTVLMSHFLSGVRVEEIMSSPVKTVNPQDTVQSVMQTMFREKHMGYPVVEDGQLVGIVTFHDISQIPEKYYEKPVSSFMKKEVQVASPEDEVILILEKLNRFGIGRMPVVESGRLRGIVSRTDILRVLEMRKEFK